MTVEQIATLMLLTDAARLAQREAVSTAISAVLRALPRLVRIPARVILPAEWVTRER